MQDVMLVDGTLTTPQFRYDQLVCYESYAGYREPIARIVGLLVASASGYEKLSMVEVVGSEDVWGYDLMCLDGMVRSRIAWELAPLGAPGNFTKQEETVGNVIDAGMTQNGPGKFSYAVDEIAYAATMEGWESEHEGTDDYAGNIWLIYEADFLSVSLRHEGQTPLNLVDRAFLGRQHACVCIERTTGFFEVEWFIDPDAAKRSYDRQVGGFTLPDDWDGE